MGKCLLKQGFAFCQIIFHGRGVLAVFEMQNVALDQRGHIQQSLLIFITPLAGLVIQQTECAECNTFFGMQRASCIKHNVRVAADQRIVVKPQIEPGISDN